jgi:KduI/IolB family
MKGLFASKALAVAGVMIATVLGLSTVRNDDTRIIVVSHDQANDPLWSVVKNGVAAAGKETGVTVECPAPKNLRYGCDVATDRRGRELEDLHYLNVMAGPKRVWRFHTDPAHEWLIRPARRPPA